MSNHTESLIEATGDAATPHTPAPLPNDGDGLKRTVDMRSPDDDADAVKKHKIDDFDSDSDEDSNLPPGQTNGIPNDLKPFMLGPEGATGGSNKVDSLPKVDTPDRPSNASPTKTTVIDGRPIPAFTPMETASPRSIRLRSNYVNKNDLETMLANLRVNIRNDMRDEYEKHLQTEVNQAVDLRMQNVMESFVRPEVNNIVQNTLHSATNSIQSLSKAYTQVEHEVRTHGLLLTGMDETMKSIPEMIQARVDEAMAPRDQQIQNLNLRLQEKDEQLKEQKEMLEVVTRQERVDVLLIDGFLVERGKTLKTNVCENIKYYFDEDIDTGAIKHVSRFGPNGEDGMPKSLRVKFHDPDFKNMLMNKKGKLRGTSVYIREHLTAHQLDIYTQAKQAQKNDVLYKVWQRNGQIFGCDTENDRGSVIHDLDALLNINSAIESKKGEEPMESSGMGLDEIKATAAAPNIESRDDFPSLEEIKGNFMKKQKAKEYGRNRPGIRGTGRGHDGSSSKERDAQSEDRKSSEGRTRRPGRGRGRGRGGGRGRPRARGRGRFGSFPPSTRGGASGISTSNENQMKKDQKQSPNLSGNMANNSLEAASGQPKSSGQETNSSQQPYSFFPSSHHMVGFNPNAGFVPYPIYPPFRSGPRYPMGVPPFAPDYNFHMQAFYPGGGH